MINVLIDIEKTKKAFLAYVFDYNFECAKEIVRKNNYVKKIIEKVNLEDEETINLVQRMYEEIKNNYL